MRREISTLITPYVGVLLAGTLAGVAVPSISWQVTLSLLVGAAAVLALAAVRIAMRPAEDVPPVAAETPVEDERLRFARLLYYLGAATIGFLTVRPALDFTASDFIFLVSLGLAGLVILMRGLESEYLMPSVITTGILVFAVGGLVSSLEAIVPIASAAVVVRMLYLTLVWFWLGTVVLQTRDHVAKALVAWVCSAALSSSGAVIQFVLGNVIPGGFIHWGRMTGFTPHFNNLGGLAATAFVPALMLAVDGRGRLRIIGVASVGLLCSGLFLSGSIGGVLAASVATIFWLALRGVTLRIVVGLAVVAASGFVLMSATGGTYSYSPIKRLERVTSAEEAAAGTGGTLYTRLEGYSAAWSHIKEQPLVGVGLDPWSTGEILGAHGVHNIILNPWFSAGVLGLVGMLMLIGGCLACGVRVLRSSPSDQRPLVSATLAAVVGFLIFAMGEPILFVRYGWFPSALLIALRAQQLRAQFPWRQRAPSRRPSLAYSPGGMR